jgi:hypothetical protein
MLARRSSAANKAEIGSRENALFLKVSCPNRRGRPINGRYSPETTCSHTLGFVHESARGKLILYCGSCGSFFVLSITSSGSTLTLINKKDVGRVNRLKCRILGYQTQI